MKAIVIIMGIIIALALILGITTLTNVPDCGNDIECFKESALECRKAVFRDTTPSSGGLTVTMKAEIKGGTSENCEFYMVVEKVNIPEGLSEAEKEQAEITAKTIEGLELTCFLPTSVLGEKGVPTGVDMEQGQCSGSLLSWYSGP